MKYLENKKILLIAPTFFGYERDIKLELESKGAEVVFLADEREVWNEANEESNKTILKRKYDLLFLIKGDFINVKMIELFIKQNPNSERIMYQYDSLNRFPHIVEMFPYFDRIYSFDIDDCKKYNLKLRPLFFSYKKKSNTNDFLYDISSVCSFYSNRMDVMLMLKKQLKNTSVKLKYYIYFHWKAIILTFFKNYKYFLYLTPKSLSRKKMFEILDDSKAILDIPFEGQNGLTIRTFETIGLEKKLITTNKSVSSYDFYDVNNIFILDTNNIDNIPEFLNKEYRSISPQIMDKYNIESFCKTMICGLEQSYYK